MRIKRLDISGFKSFPDKTTLLFDKPIVGIVGPNGCGKSNIVDAIRWVMGEQSVKSLRGRNREDVIFAGSESRPPKAVAEVTLTFDNRARLAPAQYNVDDLSVCRKLYRSGESDFFINKSPCRLKDITHLFLGSGAGNKAYSIIEQGRIGLIVSAKPEDRRYMIEEAAGITRYHSRRREAERKMQQTRQNLLRTEDVLAEQKRQLNSLNRQAKKAERYRVIKSRLKELEMASAAFEYDRLNGAIAKKRKELGGLLEERARSRTGLDTMETKLETVRIEQDRNEARLRDLGEEIHELERLISLEENNRKAYREEEERIRSRKTDLANTEKELEKQKSELADQIEASREKKKELLSQIDEKKKALEERRKQFDEAEASYRDAQKTVDERKSAHYKIASRIDSKQGEIRFLYQRISDSKDRISQNSVQRAMAEKECQRLEQEKAEFVAKKNELHEKEAGLRQKAQEEDTSLNELRERKNVAAKELSTIRDERLKTASRLESLMELERNLEGFAEGVRKVMSKSAEIFDEGELLGTLADAVEADADYEAALAAALTDRLQWPVTKNLEAAVKAVQVLRSKRYGRASFVPAGLTPEPSATSDAPLPRLLDRVRVREDVRNYVTSLLADVLVAGDLEEAARCWMEHPGRFSLVTPEGEFIDRRGCLTGGSSEAQSTLLLMRKREMGELEEKLALRDAEIEKQSASHEEMLSNFEALQKQLEVTRSERRQVEIAVLGVSKDLHRLEADLAREDGRRRRLDHEREEQDAQTAAWRKQAEDIEKTIQEDKDAQQQLQKQLQESQDVLLEAADRRNELSEQLRAVDVEYAQLVEQQRGLENHFSQLRQREGDMQRSVERNRDEAVRDERRQKELEEKTRESNAHSGELAEKRSHLDVIATRIREEFLQKKAHVDEMGEEAKKARKALEIIQENVQDAEVRAVRDEGARDSLVRVIQDRYALELSECWETYRREEPLSDAEEEERVDLRDKLEKIGSVNLQAIKDYEELSERHDFLTHQRDDLLGSMTALEKAIEKINRTTRKRFRETFEAVNAKFSELFPRMFEGGHAQLRLIEPENLLETGVEIEVQPPGKKLQSVSLLSGGEKALTAMSLIFAIFLYRPTPFCLLDEVDAPLDDVNIGRFIQTVRQISKVSQFILITHNRKTMEITNTLYGVTMEEPGISKIVSVDLN